MASRSQPSQEIEEDRGGISFSNFLPKRLAGWPTWRVERALNILIANCIVREEDTPSPYAPNIRNRELFVNSFKLEADERQRRRFAGRRLEQGW